MVIGYHVTLSTYGFWLPNDPRGSCSDYVGSPALLRFGRATRVQTRRSVADEPHDHALRNAAKQALKYPPVRLTGLQARSVGRGFAKAANEMDLSFWACAVLPEHMHIVLARHGFPIERVVNLLKGRVTRQLILDGLHPLARFAKPGARPPTVWGRDLWKVFLDSREAVEHAIRYVEENPVREGKPPQRWPFVKPYEGV